MISGTGLPKLPDADMILLTKTYKENRQAVVCTKCCQLDCLKHRYQIPIRDYLILQHLDLVRFIAKKFPAYMRDDLTSIGYITITEVVVEQIDNISNNNIRPYIWSAIYRQMLKFKNRDTLVGKKTDEEKIYKVLSIGENQPNLREGNTTDLLDLINNCCHSQTQLFIIQRTLEGGYTVQEIADELNFTASYVVRIRQNIADELRTKIRELDLNDKDTSRLRQATKFTRRQAVRLGK